MKRLISIVSLVIFLCVLATPAVQAATASAYINTGLQQLANQTPGDLTNADASFAQATNSDPSNDQAQVLKAATGLALVQSSSNFVQLLTAAGVTNPVQSIYNPSYGLSFTPQGLPQILGSNSDIIAFLDALRPQIDPAIVQLSQVSKNVSFTLSAQQTATFPLAVDYGDVQIALSALYLLKAISYTADSYNLETSLSDFLSQNLTFEEFLQKYPQFLNFSSTDHRVDAASAFTNANAAFQKAANFITNYRTNTPGYPNLFAIDTSDPATLATFTNTAVRFNALADSISTQQTFPSDPYTPCILDGAPIYLGALLSTTTPPRSWIGVNSFWGNFYTPGTLVDPTFSGALLQMTDPILTGYLANNGFVHQIIQGAGLFTSGIHPNFLSGQSYSTFYTDGSLLAGNYSMGKGWISPRGYGFLWDGTNYTAIEYPRAQTTKITGIKDGVVWGTYQKGRKSGGFIYQNGNYTNVDFPQGLWSGALSANGGIELLHILQYNNSTLVSSNSFTLWQGENSQGISSPIFLGTYSDGKTNHGFVGLETNNYIPVSYPGASSTFVSQTDGQGWGWGGYLDQVGAWRAYLCNLNSGQYQDINCSPLTTNQNSTNVSISGGVGGQVWGSFEYHQNGQTNYGCFLYSNGATTLLNYPGGSKTQIQPVNTPCNKLIGSYQDSNGDDRGFVYNGKVFTSFSDPLNGANTNFVWGNTNVYDIMSGDLLFSLSQPNGANGFSKLWIEGATASNAMGVYWNGKTNSVFLSYGTSLYDIGFPDAIQSWPNTLGRSWALGYYSYLGNVYPYAYHIEEANQLGIVQVPDSSSIDYTDQLISSPGVELVTTSSPQSGSSLLISSDVTPPTLITGGGSIPVGSGVGTLIVGGGGLSMGGASNTLSFGGSNRLVFSGGSVSLGSGTYTIGGGGFNGITIGGGTLSLGSGNYPIGGGGLSIGSGSYTIGVSGLGGLTIGNDTFSFGSGNYTIGGGSLNIFSGVSNSITIGNGTLSFGVLGLTGYSGSFGLGSGSLTLGSNLSLVSNGTSMIILPKATITPSVIPNQTYGAQPIGITLPTNSHGLPTTVRVVSGPATLSGTNLTITGTGTVTIAYDVAGNSSFASNSITNNFNVTGGLTNRKSQSISFSPLASKTYGQAGFALSASASSKLPVIYYSSNTNVAAVSGTNVLINGAGSAVITAYQPGSTNYNPAIPASRTLAINKSSQTIAFRGPGTNSYGAGSITLSATSSSGLPVSFDSSDITKASLVTNGGQSFLNPTGVGTVTITASQPGNNNFAAAAPAARSVVIIKGSPAISFTSNLPVAYSPGGAVSILLSASCNSGQEVSFSSSSSNIAAISGVRAIVQGAGTTTITAAVAANANWKAASVAHRLVVTKASQVIPSFATPNSVTYGSVLTLSNSNSSAGLPVRFTVVSGSARATNNTLTITGVGPVVVTATQIGNTNYLAAPALTNTISAVKADQAITFTLPATNTFRINGLIPLTGTDSSGLAITYTSKNSSILTISGTNAVMKGRGTNEVTASQAGNTNYNAATSVTRTIIIK